MTENEIYERYLPGYTKAHSPDEKDDIWDAASKQTIYELNAALQMLDGQGADKLSVNEGSRSETSVCLFPDLLSYDIPHWQFQKYMFANPNDEEGLTQSFEDAMEVPQYIATPPQGYINRLRGEWIRLYYKNKFSYGFLFSAVHYVTINVEEQLDEWIFQHYPYHIDIVDDLECEPCSSGFKSVNFVVDNEENDQQASKIRSYLYPLYEQIEIELNQQLNVQTPATYIIESVDDEGFPDVTFICKNEATMRLICPARFVENFHQLQQPADYLDMLIRQYVHSLITKLVAQGWGVHC